MMSFDLKAEQKFSSVKHVEKILGVESGGDVTVACWEPGQVSPNHRHPGPQKFIFVSKVAVT